MASNFQDIFGSIRHSEEILLKKNSIFAQHTAKIGSKEQQVSELETEISKLKTVKKEHQTKVQKLKLELYLNSEVLAEQTKQKGEVIASYEAGVKLQRESSLTSSTLISELESSVLSLHSATAFTNSQSLLSSIESKKNSLRELELEESTLSCELQLHADSLKELQAVHADCRRLFETLQERTRMGVRERQLGVGERRWGAEKLNERFLLTAEEKRRSPLGEGDQPPNCSEASFTPRASEELHNELIRNSNSFCDDDMESLPSIDEGLQVLTKHENSNSCKRDFGKYVKLVSQVEKRIAPAVSSTSAIPPEESKNVGTTFLKFDPHTNIGLEAEIELMEEEAAFQDVNTNKKYSTSVNKQTKVLVSDSKTYISKNSTKKEIGFRDENISRSLIKNESDVKEIKNAITYPQGINADNPRSDSTYDSKSSKLPPEVPHGQRKLGNILETSSTDQMNKGTWNQYSHKSNPIKTNISSASNAQPISNPPVVRFKFKKTTLQLKQSNETSSSNGHVRFKFSRQSVVNSYTNHVDKARNSHRDINDDHVPTYGNFKTSSDFQTRNVPKNPSMPVSQYNSGDGKLKNNATAKHNFVFHSNSSTNSSGNAGRNLSTATNSNCHIGFEKPKFVFRPTNSMNSSDNSFRPTNLMNSSTSNSFRPTNPMNSSANNSFRPTNPMNSSTSNSFRPTNPMNSSTSNSFIPTNPMNSSTSNSFRPTNPMNSSTSNSFRPTNPMNSSTSNSFRPTNPMNSSTNNSFRPTNPMNSSTSNSFRPTYPMNSSTSNSFRPTNPMNSSTSNSFRPTNPMNSSTSNSFRPTNPMNSSTNNSFRPTNPMNSSTSNSFRPTNPMNSSTSNSFRPTNPMNSSTSNSFRATNPTNNSFSKPKFTFKPTSMVKSINNPTTSNSIGQSRFIFKSCNVNNNANFNIPDPTFVPTTTSIQLTSPLRVGKVPPLMTIPNRQTKMTSYCQPINRFNQGTGDKSVAISSSSISSRSSHGSSSTSSRTSRSSFNTSVPPSPTTRQLPPPMTVTRDSKSSR